MSNIPQITNLNNSTAAAIQNNIQQINQYFKQQNWSGAAVNIFESDWQTISCTSLGAVTSTPGGTVPLRGSFSATQELSIPSYLLPYIKVSLIVQTAPGNQVVGVTDYQYTYTVQSPQEWTTITGDGGILYTGPAIFSNTDAITSYPNGWALPANPSYKITWQYSQPAYALVFNTNYPSFPSYANQTEYMTEATFNSPPWNTPSPYTLIVSFTYTGAVFIYFDPACQYPIQGYPTDAEYLFPGGNLGTGITSSLPYGIITVKHETITTSSGGITSGSISHNFTIVDPTNENSNYLLSINDAILISTPANVLAGYQEVQTVTAVASSNQNGVTTSHYYAITGGTSIPTGAPLFTANAQDCQVKYRVDVINPSFIKEDKTYSNINNIQNPYSDAND